MSTDQVDAPPLAGAFGLLERSVAYTRASLGLVAPDDLTRSSPCAGWDLRTLLQHLHDSLTALQQAGESGAVELCPAPDVASTADLVEALRSRASSLLGAWANNEGADLVSVAGCPVTATVLASTGALEIAVHGWDVARACGHDRPLPPRLAEELLVLVPLVVTDGDRPRRFAAALDVPAHAGASERLLAVLGRRCRS
ncbi:MAG: TIGR03086 family metal-binding protein [Nocardioidaceae bacterium]